MAHSFALSCPLSLREFAMNPFLFSLFTTAVISESESEKDGTIPAAPVGSLSLLSDAIRMYSLQPNPASSQQIEDH